jgi:ABC-2 type transport system permease protein
MKTLFYLIRKELLQFKRNTFLPKLILAFPIVMMLILPLIANMEVKNVSVVIVDNDYSSLSRLLAEKMDASSYFTLKGTFSSYNEALSLLEESKVDAVLSIPQDWEKSLSQPHPQRVSISTNGVNSTKGSIGGQYLSSLVLQTMQASLGSQASIHNPLTVINFYNPTQDYRRFMIPALMIMVIIMLCCFLPTLNIVSEKEEGTMEQMNVTPVPRFTFIASKLIPYWIMGLLVLGEAMIIAWLVYNLSPMGSIGTIFLGALLFILTMSGFGLLISNISGNMQQAMFVMFFFVIIFILMSGLFTPVTSMPAWCQKLAYAFPPRYFIEIMRDVYLKGTHLVELWPNLLALTGFAAFFDTWAILSYRKQQ